MFRLRRRLLYGFVSLFRGCHIRLQSPTLSRRFSGLTLAAAGVIFTLGLFAATGPQFPREDALEQRIVAMQMHLQYLDSQYRARQEDLVILQNKIKAAALNVKCARMRPKKQTTTTVKPEITAILKNLTGTYAAIGMQAENLQDLRVPFLYQMMPHLLNDRHSLRTAYQMSKNKPRLANVVIGVPTVKRDKESYLMITLSHLVENMTPSDLNSTLIVVFIGETDLAYVLNVAHSIESMFPKQVADGLIEVISPPASYYPDLYALTPTLGDSAKRHRWRTKQNLDTIFLMAYAQSRGLYYLMLEDDVIAKKHYMQEIQKQVQSISVSHPHWVIVEFCQIGGIGKLFRSSKLSHFITYVQLFYTNMPIDWLFESYLADLVCGVMKTSKQCSKSLLTVKVKYKGSLFQHIGLYSSLKGKIQKLKDSHFGTVQTFFPHVNPPASLKSSIEPYSGHTLQKAYDGVSFFWGIQPKKGDTIQFWFHKPTNIKTFMVRSSNVEHVSDKFYDTVVEVLPAFVKEKVNASYVQVASFDEFGIAEGDVPGTIGPLACLQIRVLSNSKAWVIISEIVLKTEDAI